MLGFIKGLFGAGAKPQEGVKARDPNRIRRLRGDGEFSEKAAGTSHYQEALIEIKAGFRKHTNPDIFFDVVPEPTNQHDKEALQLQHEGKLVGYIPAFMTSEVHDALQRLDQAGQQCRVKGRIVGHETKGLGVRLNIRRPAGF